jgi:hypothetical protein
MKEIKFTKYTVSVRTFVNTGFCLPYFICTVYNTLKRMSQTLLNGRRLLSLLNSLQGARTDFHTCRRNPTAK